MIEEKKQLTTSKYIEKHIVLIARKILILNSMILARVAKELFAVVGHVFVNGKSLVFFINNY